MRIKVSFKFETAGILVQITWIIPFIFKQIRGDLQKNSFKKKKKKKKKGQSDTVILNYSSIISLPSSSYESQFLNATCLNPYLLVIQKIIGLPLNFAVK